MSDMVVGNAPMMTCAPHSARRVSEIAAPDQAKGPNFGEQISAAFTRVDAPHNPAAAIIDAVASGNISDAHQAIVAQEHALMALDFTLQVRNRALEAYQEIMRTQI